MLCFTTPNIYPLCSNYAYQDAITSGPFTLTFRLCINSDCMGPQSLLIFSEDVGDETVAFELLSVAYLVCSF